MIRKIYILDIPQVVDGGADEAAGTDLDEEGEKGPLPPGPHSCYFHGKMLGPGKGGFQCRSTSALSYCCGKIKGVSTTRRVDCTRSAGGPVGFHLDCFEEYYKVAKRVELDGTPKSCPECDAPDTKTPKPKKRARAKAPRDSPKKPPKSPARAKAKK